MFEVTLRQDYEDLFFFRDFDVTGVTNNQNAAHQGGEPNSQQTIETFKESPRRGGSIGS